MGSITDTLSAVGSWLGNLFVSAQQPDLLLDALGSSATSSDGTVLVGPGAAAAPTIVAGPDSTNWTSGEIAFVVLAALALIALLLHEVDAI